MTDTEIKSWVKKNAGKKWNSLEIPSPVLPVVARNGFWMDGQPWQWIGNGARRIPRDFQAWIVDGELRRL